MVADKLPVSMPVMIPMPVVPVESYIEVPQHKEPREPEVPPPKWIWDPAIQVCKIRRRGIVSDDGRSLVVIVIVNHFSVRIIRGSRLVRRRV